MRIPFKFSIPFFIVLNTFLPSAAQIPVFPGAEGFGATTTTGGRGGQVMYVTNLNCNGPGSLNEALATPGKKYILFKVSGIIDCAAEVVHGDCYIAGQTAPGGIIVRGIYIDDWYDPNGGARNVVIRHLNSRPHTENERSGAGWVMDDALRLDGASRIVVDHCTFANGTDEQIQISRSNNVTIQHSILAEPVGDHYMFGGMLLNYSAANHRQDSISIHHNLWYRVGGRFPEISCEQSGEAPNDMSCLQYPLRLELSNNVLWDQQIEVYYNSGFYTSNQEAHGLQLRLNLVNNRSVVRSNFCHGMYRSLMLGFNDNQLFTEGNTMSKYASYSDYDLFYCCNDFCDAANHPNTDLGVAQRRNTRFPFPNINYTPTEQLVGYLHDHAGAFNCFSPGRRDPMNRRILQPLQSQVIDNHAINGVDYFHDAFDLDFSAAPQPPQDSDADGMPDAWEITHGLNPAQADHNGTQLSVLLTGVAGYTNLECYLNLLSDQLISGSSCSTTDTKDVEQTPRFEVRYHAATQQLTLLLDAPVRNARYTLFDANGRMIIQSTMHDSAEHISCCNWAPGIYFIKVHNGGKTAFQKVAVY